MLVLAATMVAVPASATTTLTIDLSKTFRPATRVANGSLYGVTETKPADLTNLLGPLRPNMFSNPAANVQRPFGDAIAVAQRLAPFGATVTIKFSDWFTGYYAFTNMTDFSNKIATTINRKKAANLTNIYAYEIWNEPDISWGNDKPMSFNEFWRQSYAVFRQLDPTVKIAGPSPAVFNSNNMSSFLSFCKANNCLPDIMVWHEGEWISNNVQAYRRLEQQLGIGPLPISINEYCGYGMLREEGKPGTMGPLIAQLERSGVETAGITWWDTPNPGRLGSLLATDTQRNGGWFFYKWYGEMTGNMVAVTSSLPVNGKNLDGFASLDATARNAFVILAGVNDGSVNLVVKGFNAASFLGSTVHAVVERTPFVDRSTVVNSTNTLSMADVAVANDQITVSISNANANDGYRLSLTPVGGGTDGAGGSGGAGGIDGAAGSGGAAGNSGAAGADAGSGRGGAGGSGTGGANAGAGGRSGSAGTAGAIGAGGSGPSRGGNAGGPGAVAGDESGCSCAVYSNAGTPASSFFGCALALLAIRRHTSRSRDSRRARTGTSTSRLTARARRCSPIAHMIGSREDSESARDDRLVTSCVGAHSKVSLVVQAKPRPSSTSFRYRS